jgi:2,4-dienoyl-CoA reductase-like NADH-dependent reductase (Old Yellow Enzyme family)
MEEILGTTQGDPSEKDLKLYEEWAEGGWGLVLTGRDSEKRI